MRKDAKRIRNLGGMEQILVDLKPQRCDSDVYINQKMDVTELVKYVNNKKKNGSDITYFHTFVTAIGKTLYNRPKLNRFIANRHVYEHNDVVISFVAKVSFDDKSEEVMIMIPINENDNLESISKKIMEKVSGFRNKKSKKEGANSAIDILGKLPNIIRVPVVGILKWFDKNGMLPKSLVSDNVYYSSMMVSNLGSIKCGAIYHNITNFGTCSSLVTMGEIKDEEVIVNGKKEIRKLCEFGMNFDERIADGYYFVKSAKILQYIFDNPKLLEDSANTKVEIKENE
ncbi:MAG: 2-oxo acid dehydrogenase subunit E2 [Bacilli bacterium]|nr:2-oxo acid dehydrogenase subunit E2 [Bacilli bacterium]